MIGQEYSLPRVLLAARHMVDNPIVEVFVWAVVFDLASGFAKAFSRKAKHKADSSVGIFGAVKHLLIVMLVLTLYPMVDTLGFSSFGSAVVIFYIFTYALSIVENLAVLGIPVPKFVSERLEKLSRESDEGHIKTFGQAKAVVTKATEEVKKEDTK